MSENCKLLEVCCYCGLSSGGGHAPPEVLLLADDSQFALPLQSRRLFLAGMTAAKKTILKCLVEPSISFFSIWLNYLHDIILLERTMAGLHLATANTTGTVV